MRQLKISKSITNRESQSIEKYLQEIGREDLINSRRGSGVGPQNPPRRSNRTRKINPRQPTFRSVGGQAIPKQLTFT
jgi:hypothetical protein